MLDVRPDDAVLEIGCGGGVAVELVCSRLGIGTILAIDRSPIAIDRATRRNRDCIAAGKAQLRVASLESIDLDPDRFTTIFAINVNLFWVRDAGRELAVLSRALSQGGRLVLFYDPPSATQLSRARDRVSAALTAADFVPTATTGGRAERLLCITAAPGPRGARAAAE